MNKLDERYKNEKAPSKRGKYANWTAAKGLQQVDGLKTSHYLDEVAQRDIEGEIDAYRAKELIDSYYHTIAKVEEIEQHAEADMVAARINILISEQAFTLSTEELVDIHARLFEGVFEFAGQIRTRNIIKYEWVLAGDTVTYGNAYNLRANVDSLMKKERLTPFRQMDDEERIYHLARFCADLWQLHPFDEGNTRTTAVFMIKYLRTLGYDVDNTLFQDNSRYFRNALVRANYINLKKNIFEERVFLENFFIDLVDGTRHEMKSRYLLVGTDGTLLIDRDLNSRILSLIDANPSITRSQMAEQLQVSVKTIERHLKELADKVTRTGSKRNGTWKVEDNHG
jgi:fido (protein-threonine AMPylation protein)